jgi:hypothetical protein
MALPSPEQARSWFQTAYLAVEKSTPITLLLLLLLSGLFGGYLLRQVEHSRTTVLTLYTALIAAKDLHLAQAQAFRTEMRDLLEDCRTPSGER